MTQKILVLAGKKQSGKNTAANFVVGYTITQLARQGVPYLPTRFTIDEETGELIISPPTNPTITDREEPEGEHILNLYDKTPEVQMWLSDCVYPRIKLYGFADMLKAVVASVFGISEELLYGTDEDKRQPIHIKWKDMAPFLAPQTVSQLKKSERYEKAMTIRDFLQCFGTNICRRLDSDCWIKSCYRRIEIDQADIAIVSDARFRNEIMVSKKYDARIVKLTRTPFAGDVHDSEIDLDKMHNNNFDLVIPPDVTIREQNQLLLDAMYKWEWFDRHLGLEV